MTEAILVLVGITAGWRKRRAIRRGLSAGALPVHVPWLPFAFGLRLTARWLNWWAGRHLAGVQRLHVLAYIGGAGVLRRLAPGALPPIGHLLLDRGPIQEKVPAALARLAPPLVIRLLGGAGMLDLMDPLLAARPLPSGTRGLMIETRPSRLARALGLDAPDIAFDPGRIDPLARQHRSFALSHDEVYSDPAFTRAALEFLSTGRFSERPDDAP